VHIDLHFPEVERHLKCTPSWGGDWSDDGKGGRVWGLIRGKTKNIFFVGLAKKKE